MWYWVAAAVLSSLLLLAAPLACTTTVVPPPQPADPVRVFVLDHGMTATLALPAPGGRLVRYAYGEWNYYALANNTVADGIRALFWPTQGTLGRATPDGPFDAELSRARAESEAVHQVLVERAAAERLVERLQAEYAAQHDTEVVNARYGMRFVHHGQPYTYFHNSNHALAGWLEELGCEVRGPAYVSRWRVERRE